MGLFARIDGLRPPTVALAGIGAERHGSGSRTHAVTFGDEDRFRYLIAVIGYDDGTGGSITSCTIGGVTATRAARGNTSGSVGGRTYSDIWIAKVPTGTSGDVVISGVGGNWGSYCAVYRALYLRSATAADSGGDSGLPITFDLDVPARGIVIATAMIFIPAGSATWSGATVDLDQVYSASGLSGASGAFSSATTLSLSGTWTGGGDSPAGCGASFR